jgi:hypothetical protein
MLNRRDPCSTSLNPPPLYLSLTKKRREGKFSFFEKKEGALNELTL